MWIWIVSLVVLIACFLFAWRMMVSSYDLIPTDKKFSMFKSYKNSDTSYLTESLRTMKSKLKSLEEQNSYFELQFTKLQQKVKSMEENQSILPHSVGIPNTDAEEPEDWKELYYEENERKEHLENELDETHQQLEQTRHELGKLKKEDGTLQSLGNENDKRLEEIASLKEKVVAVQSQLEVATQREGELDETQQRLEKVNHELEERKKGYADYQSLKSNFDMRLTEIDSLKEQMGAIQMQLNGARQREKELDEKVREEIHKREELGNIESKHHHVKAENEDLRNQLVQLSSREKEYLRRLEHMKELESKLAIFEEEKSKMIADLEHMVSQTKAMAAQKNS